MRRCLLTRRAPLTSVIYCDRLYADFTHPSQRADFRLASTGSVWVGTSVSTALDRATHSPPAKHERGSFESARRRVRVAAQQRSLATVGARDRARPTVARSSLRRCD